MVSAVHDGSIAAEMDLQPGDRVLAVDGQDIEDIIDFQYLTAEDEFTLVVEKEDGELWELEIERSEGEPLGLQVETVGPGGLKTCRNNCIFCFVAQMPKGLRSTLYCKDDDYRLSLTEGSFITLSNLGREDWRRILEWRLSPLYISVHAWDPVVRQGLMKNPQAGDLPTQLQRLAAANITMHTQIVLIPGRNDGAVLAETVKQLAALHPAVQSIAVVPVGLTGHREGLVDLRPFTGAEAARILADGERWQQEFRQRTGLNLVYYADEFYVLAGRSVPGVSAYDGFPQIENGVGMMTKFMAEIAAVWPNLPAAIPLRRCHLITGVSAAPFFTGWGQRLMKRVTGLDVVVHPVRNHFFGETVTVAGLVTAGDIAGQVGGLNGEAFLLPQVMLRSGEDVFLDDRPVTWLEERLDGRARVVANDGQAFIEAVLKREGDEE